MRRVHRLAGTALVSIGLLVASAGQAQVSRNMTGSLGVINPSVTGLGLPLFNRGPQMLAYTLGSFSPQNPAYDFTKTVMVTGTTAGTSTGRAVTLPAGAFFLKGHQFRTFKDFAKVAHGTFDYSTTQAEATFMIGGGALGDCPGNGCTQGAGTKIQWCPPASDIPASPAPGTPANRRGNWTCPAWSLPGGGNQAVRLSITNNNPNRFGGSLLLMRNTTNSIRWRVVNTALNIVSRAPARETQPFTGGAGAGQFGYIYNKPPAAGAQLFGALGPNGSVTATFGCTNPTGSVGTVFPGPPPTNVFPGSGLGGVNCGTPPQGPAQQGWGFRMTTGTVSGSDFFPGLIATTVNGTPFSPNVIFNAPGSPPNLLSPPFFFTRMGTDQVNTAMTQRNIVLQGGGIATDPASTNLFFRHTDLRLNLPEPSKALGLAIGALALAGLAMSARRRR
jgi:hypothetical protein